MPSDLNDSHVARNAAFILTELTFPIGHGLNTGTDPLATDADLGQVRKVMPARGHVVEATLSMRSRGTGGATTVQLRNITRLLELFADASRPSVAGAAGGGINPFHNRAQTVQNANFSAGDVLAMVVDAVATGAGADGPVNPVLSVWVRMGKWTTDPVTP